MVDKACMYQNVSKVDLARNFGASTTQSFTKRLDTEKFTPEELKTIFNMLDAEFVIEVRFSDGFTLKYNGQMTLKMIDKLQTSVLMFWNMNIEKYELVNMHKNVGDCDGYLKCFCAY